MYDGYTRPVDTDTARCETLREFILPAVPESASVARDQLRPLLSDVLGAAVADDVRLAVTELVTNVIRHAGVEATDELAVTVMVEADRVRVSVRQPTTAMNASAADGDRDAVGGWGLMIVDRITDRWGVEAGPPGEIWFEVVRRPDPAV